MEVNVKGEKGRGVVIILYSWHSFYLFLFPIPECSLVQESWDVLHGDWSWKNGVIAEKRKRERITCLVRYVTPYPFEVTRGFLCFPLED
jgi:hypothetical protein